MSAEWADIKDNVLMVKFDRQLVQKMFTVEDVGDVELMVTGEVDGVPLECSDTIRVIRLGKGNETKK